METMRVRIIKSEAWHTGMVGQEFNVRYKQGDNGYVTIADTGPYKGNGLLATDYEVVPAADKIVEHEGIKYQVPGWAKFLTRDKAGYSVFAWEKEPSWVNDKSGYQERSDGRRIVVRPYVEPKPEGNFKKEI